MSRVRCWEDELPLHELRPGIEPRWGSWTLHRPAPDLGDCIAGRLPDSRHLLVLWEPLPTKAPSPARCQPYCCYIRTVVFYHRPWISRGTGYPWKGDGRWHFEASRNAFAKFDQIETRLSFDDVVAFDGDDWEIAGGHVQWHRGRWWMRHWARRKATVENRQLVSEGDTR